MEIRLSVTFSSPVWTWLKYLSQFGVKPCNGNCPDPPLGPSYLLSWLLGVFSTDGYHLSPSPGTVLSIRQLSHFTLYPLLVVGPYPMAVWGRGTKGWASCSMGVTLKSPPSSRTSHWIGWDLSCIVWQLNSSFSPIPLFSLPRTLSSESAAHKTRNLSVYFLGSLTYDSTGNCTGSGPRKQTLKWHIGAGSPVGR